MSQDLDKSVSVNMFMYGSRQHEVCTWRVVFVCVGPDNPVQKTDT